MRNVLARFAAAAVLLLGTLGALGANAPVEVAPAPGSDAQTQVREMNLYVEEWKWTPDTIRVAQGTHVVLHIRSFDASRTFSMKGYKLKVPLPQDQVQTVEFDATRKGTFPWTCERPCGNGCAKLKGTLIVD